MLTFYNILRQYVSDKSVANQGLIDTLICYVVTLQWCVNECLPSPCIVIIYYKYNGFPFSLSVTIRFRTPCVVLWSCDTRNNCDIGTDHHLLVDSRSGRVCEQ